MNKLFEARLGKLAQSGQEGAIRKGKIGLEKETLRVGIDGSIAQTPHPAALGAPLTHPYITTDYSEALTEFITPPFEEMSDALNFLKETQQFVYANLDEELLWATSMPCVIAGETNIPIAEYGSSNLGMMKTVYRRGLGYRYGRAMQVIAGVHFNYSLPENFWPVYRELEGDKTGLRVFTSERYFDLIRNLQRFGWLVPYLFGASPAVCKSFLGGKPTTLDEFNESTYYEPFATSLRMGDIGYQNNKENEVGVKANYNSLAEYVSSLELAISTPSPEYERIGTLVDGEYRQLNCNLLQIENEYYSTMRPKQVLQGNEKPIHALSQRGVGYVELRSLDVNAFDPMGIAQEQLLFLEAFLIYCLLNESPAIDAEGREEIDYNELVVAHRGRQPGLKLRRRGKEIDLKDWALEICTDMQAICTILEAGNRDRGYSRVLENQREAVLDPERTPSARMLQEMRQENEGFYHFALRMSKQHQEFFRSLPLSEDKIKFFEGEAEHSIQRQHEIEASEQLPFDKFLSNYFSQ